MRARIRKCIRRAVFTSIRPDLAFVCSRQTGGTNGPVLTRVAGVTLTIGQRRGRGQGMEGVLWTVGTNGIPWIRFVFSVTTCYTLLRPVTALIPGIANTIGFQGRSFGRIEMRPTLLANHRSGRCFVLAFSTGKTGPSVFASVPGITQTRVECVLLPTRSVCTFRALQTRPLPRIWLVRAYRTTNTRCPVQGIYCIATHTQTPFNSGTSSQ